MLTSIALRKAGLRAMAIAMTAALPLTAQQSQTPADAWRVTLIASDRLPVGNSVAVIRRVSARPSQLILVSGQATASDLARAIGTLGALRARDGENPPADVQVMLTSIPEQGAGLLAESARVR